MSRLLEIIRLSASSFGLQPWKVKIITDAETKKLLAPASWNQKQITTCSHILVFCANTDIERNIIKLEEAIIKNGAKKEDTTLTEDKKVVRTKKTRDDFLRN